jgi:hypothetical protein
MLKTAAQPRVELGFHLGERSRVYFLRTCSLKKSCSGEESHILWQSTGWASPNLSGISSSAYPLRNENISCLVSRVSTSLQRHFKFLHRKDFAIRKQHIHTQCTQWPQKSSNIAWRKENPLSKPQPQSDVVTHACHPNSRLRQTECHEIEASLGHIPGYPRLHSKPCLK